MNIWKWGRKVRARGLHLSTYKSLFKIQDGRNDNNEKRTKKQSQQTIIHYDSDITCPEISYDDEQHTRQIKAKLFLTFSNNLYITGSKQFHEEYL